MTKQYWISRFDSKSKERYDWIKSHKREGDAINRAIDFMLEKGVDFKKEQVEESTK